MVRWNHAQALKVLLAATISGPGVERRFLFTYDMPEDLVTNETGLAHRQTDDMRMVVCRWRS